MAKVCRQCHNAKSKNTPEIPGRAELTLRRFRSIGMYYRFISRHGEPADTQTFFKTIDPKKDSLSAEWHTFDLDAFETKTDALLAQVRQRSQAIRDRRKPPPPPSE